MNKENIEVLKQEYDQLIDEIPNVKKVNKNFSIAVISIFVSLLVLPSVTWGVLKLASLGNPKIIESVTLDTEENRKFAEFPTEIDIKTLPSDLENWYNDNIPFRSVLYLSYKNVNDFIEAPYTEVIRPALLKLLAKPTEEGRLTNDDSGQPQSSNSSDTQTDNIDSTASSQQQSSDNSDVISNGNSNNNNNNNNPNNNNNSNNNNNNNNVNSNSSNNNSSNNNSSKVEGVVSKPTNNNNSVTSSSTNTEPEYEFIPPIYHGKGGTVIEGKNKWLFYNNEYNQEYYKGSNLLTAAELQNYTNVLTTLNNICKQKGIILQCAVWPNKEQIYSEFVPTTEIVNQYKRVQRWTDYISSNTDVKIMYPIKELLNAKRFDQIYYKYDTHWNDLGAYVGYTQLMKSLGYQVPDIGSLKINVKATGFRHDLRSMAGLSANSYSNDSFFQVEYKSNIKVQSQSTSINPEYYQASTSNGAIDCNFVLVGDSYRESMVPYIQKDFTNTHIINNKYISRYSENIPAIQNADIIVLCAVERYDYNVIKYAEELIDILS